MYREFFVILTVVTTSQFVAAKKNETLPTPHVIIVGPTGAGKSSLACALTGGDPTSETCLFPVCHDMDSCTKNTSYCGNMTWIGDESNPLFTVVDTPGFEDTDDQMDELIEEMTDVLNNDVKTADVVLLTIPATTAKFTKGLIDMLKQLEMLFGRKMWNSTMIEISKFSYDPDDIQDRKDDCEEDPDECRDEAFFYYEINRELEKNFHLGMNLSMVFIDSYARKDSNLDDEIQQQHFLEETDKLWDFAKNTPEFKFKTVDEVLEENAIMRDEIICLNGIINDELNKTLEDMKQLKEMLTQETYERKMNDETLTDSIDNLNSDLTSLEEFSESLNEKTDELNITLHETTIELTQSLNDTEKRLTQSLNDTEKRLLDLLDKEISDRNSSESALRSDIQDLPSLKMPFGTIMAWVPAPSKDVYGNYSVTDPIIPEGWVRCDGTIINDGPWAGMMLPNLNVDHYFLRGGHDTEALDFEDDSIRSHNHDVTIKFEDYYSDANTYTAGHSGTGIYDRDFKVRDVTASSSTTNNGSDETRPKNMKVVWIMRIPRESEP